MRQNLFSVVNRLYEKEGQKIVTKKISPAFNLE